jgi:membrane-bound lytic murein transglycosylase D
VQLPFRDDHSLRDGLYADIYEKSSRKNRRARRNDRMIATYGRKGKLIKNPSVYYTVKKGDTLWRVAQRTGVPMSTIIRTNSHLIKRRQILPGDRLAIR